MIGIVLKSHYKSIVTVLLFVFLLSWAIVSSISLIRAETKVLVIKVNKDGTELIRKDSLDDRSTQDVLNFINAFVLSYYSYSNITYDSQKKRALELFSEDFFQEQLSLAIEQKKKQKNRVFIQEAIVRKVDELGNGIIEAELEKTVYEGAKEHKVFSTLILTIGKIKRFEENPYGFEVIALSEKKRF